MKLPVRRSMFRHAATALTFLTIAVPADATPEVAVVQCVVPIYTDSGAVWGSRELPGAGTLIGATNGLFLARAADGKVAVARAGDADTGTVQRFQNLPGAGTLIGAEKGLFLARVADGKVAVARVGDADPGTVWKFHDLPGAGSLLHAANGLFLARAVDDKVAVARTGDADTGTINGFQNLPGAGTLIGATNGLFLARAADGKVAVARAGDVDTGYVWRFHDLPGAGTLLDAAKGLFLVRVAGGKVAVARAGTDADTGTVNGFQNLPGAGTLIGAENGLFLARAVDGKVAVARAGDADTGTVRRFHDLPGAGTLIDAANGLFLARAADGKVAVARAGDADTATVWVFQDLPGAGTLIGATNGLFLARVADGKVAVARAGDGDTGTVWKLHDLPGAGSLLDAANGLFLARAADGKVAVARAGDADTGTVWGFHDFPGAGTLIDAANGLFLVATTPLSRAAVDLPEQNDLDGSAIDPKRRFIIKLTFVHPCSLVADKLGLKIRVITPNGEPKIEEPQSVSPGPSAADVYLARAIEKPGQWKFQVISTSGGVERLVGGPQELRFISAAGPPSWQESGKWLAGWLVGILVVANAALFVLARRSAWAWRIATDDSWNTGVLRFATFLLSHFTKPQLWILDLYFWRLHNQGRTRSPFVPLPLTGGDGSLRQSDEAVAPPWTGRRLWVQGGGGMGKTALFRHITEAHFGDDETAFAAFARWGCVLVAFAARDFAASGEDKDDPAWVFDAVRATLSSQGLKFANRTLLSRFLENGTLGVAIDGLNEVDRTRAIAAFSRVFPDAPILVTSQQSGDDRFCTWRLPSDIRDFTLDLLRLHLTMDEAEAVMQRITASGLNDEIRSGYDVRLIIDLARIDPYWAGLPADRKGLYAAVIAAGWPNASEETCVEQKNRTAAAAWRMVSERKPNEDMRRLMPDVDLAADLLEALANVPERENKPMRILRRVGGRAFEFVHDQMHFYMAARWLAQDGNSAAELEKMVASSMIWAQSPDARRTLWGFAAALLDDERLITLWKRIDDKEEFDSLRRALKAEAERRGATAAFAQLGPSLGLLQKS